MSDNMSDLHENSVESLGAKIKSIRFCMFTTVSDDNSLSSRPMTQQALDPDGTLWIFTSDDQPLAHDISARPEVNVTFAEPSDSTYISITGDASLVKDREKFKQLWNPMVAAWYPRGLDDPHLALIKVSIHSAEYWDSDSNKMTQLFSMAKAALTGTRPKDVGHHGKVQF